MKNERADEIDETDAFKENWSWKNLIMLASNR
jgi:hypothetical protein